MIRKEYYNERDLTYSNWHRTINHKCYAMDVDWIEYRIKNNVWQIVALIETKNDLANIDRWKEKQMPIFLKIADSLSCPAFLVLHNMSYAEKKESWRFIVLNVRTNEQKIMNENEYKNMLEKL